MGESTVGRRTVLAGAAGVAGTGALAGCVGGGGGAAKPQPSISVDENKKFTGTVEWWTINLQKNYKAYIDGMISAYKTAHPDVTINWVDVPGQDITTKLLAALAGGSAPDAVNFTSPTLGLFGGSMASLTDLFTADELKAYVPGLVDTLTFQGKQVAVPWYNGGGSLGFYRKSVCAQAGFDTSKPPKTYDDALALAQAVHDKVPAVYGMNLIPSYQLMITEGIPMLSEDRKKAAFNTDAAIAVMEKVKKVYVGKGIAPGAVGADTRNFEQSMENKQIAFSPAGTSSALVNIQKNAPDVYADIFVTQPVVGKPGKVFMFGQQVFGIPAKAKNPVAAAEWIKFVTNAENQLAFCKLVSIFPSSQKALADEFFTKPTGTAPIDVGRNELVKQFPNLVSGALGTGNDEALGTMFDDEMRAFMSGNKSAKDALTAAATKWDAELAKQK